MTPTWTPEQFREYQNRGEASSAKPQPIIRHEPLGAAEGEAQNSGRLLVSITSYRTRLLDPDNLCGKYFLDSVRYSQLIKDDKPDCIDFKISQVKVKTKAQEKTEIEVSDR